MKRVIITTLLAAVSASVCAHHSTFTRFDEEIIREIAGEVTELQWRNPHVRFTMQVETDEGQTALWEIETSSVSGFRQFDVTSVLIAIGDRIRVAGNPSRAGLNEIWVENILLADGREFVMGAYAEPRWSDDPLGMTGSEYVTEGSSSGPELGIYRVWASTAATPMLFPATTDSSFSVEDYPLTDSAREFFAAFDPLTDNPTANCTPKGMPTIMEQPYPMEIRRAGDDILLRTEEYDLVRTIHMSDSSPNDQVAATPLGYSVGNFDGNTLVVATNRISWGFFNQSGIPLSDAVEIMEYFMPAEDGSRMDYRMVVNDLSTFTELVELTKHWLYVPGIAVEPFECLPE